MNWLSWFRRVWPEGSYVLQVESWRVEEPYIKPLALPKVKKLEGKKVSDTQRD